jgi:hypothetical protein
LKNSNQGLIDPDLVFNRGHDRDEKFSSKVRSKNHMISKANILSPFCTTLGLPSSEELSEGFR